MKRETLIWSIVMLLGAAGLLAQSWRVQAKYGALPGSGYYRTVTLEKPDKPAVRRYAGVARAEAQQFLLERRKTPNAPSPADEIERRPDGSTRTAGPIRWSAERTLGIWLSAFFTLSVFSFLYGDTVCYKIAESIYVGASAAYAMVVGFYSELIPNLFCKLIPTVMRATLVPGTPDVSKMETLLAVIPLCLSGLMLMRLVPDVGWFARWPLALFIGVTAGLRLVSYFQADVIAQISNTLLPLVVWDNGRFDAVRSARHVTVLVSLLACLTYFFFSVEHRGPVGAFARLGIWVLMITFGVGFGCTVMGRIALLSRRFNFLLEDWLWLIQ